MVRIQELYKKGLNDLDNDHDHDSMVILECEVRWASEELLRTKLVEMMEFQLNYLKIQDDAVKVLHSICQ